MSTDTTARNGPSWQRWSGRLDLNNWKPDPGWRPMGITPESYPEADANGVRVLHLGAAKSPRDWAGGLLLAAASVLLLGLAATQGYVSWHQQFVFVLAAKHDRSVSGMEALGLDAAAVIFAVLAVALARLGRPAHIERALNLGCALGSMAMNLLGADLLSPRSIAVYVLPPVLYAAGSDRLISVVRRQALSRLGDDAGQRSVWHVAGTGALYLLRFVLAPPSTALGLRRWVLASAPVLAPPSALHAPQNVAALPAAQTPGSAAIATPVPRRPRAARGTSKRTQLIEAYEALSGADSRYGDRSKVSPLAAELASDVGLQPGSARTYLYRHLDSKAGA
ncbi:MAG: hypothetical protein ACRDPY_04070 [Streptosporangiaceae bacterium]